MNEIEVLVRVDANNIEEVKESILKKAKAIKHISFEDIYFYDPLRKELQPNEKNEIFNCFRIRRKDNFNYITYKNDIFDNLGNWLFSKELETKIEDFSIVKEIILKLGLKELITLYMDKDIFETEVYTISLEHVKELGIFLEVEYKNSLDNLQEIVKMRQRILQFINELGFATSQDLGIGKPELLLKKKNKYKEMHNEI